MNHQVSIRGHLSTDAHTEVRPGRITGASSREHEYVCHTQAEEAVDVQPARPSVGHLDGSQEAVHCQHLKSCKIIMYLGACNSSPGGSAWEVVCYWASGVGTEKGLLAGPDAGAGQSRTAPELLNPGSSSSSSSTGNVREATSQASRDLLTRNLWGRASNRFSLVVQVTPRQGQVQEPPR